MVLENAIFYSSLAYNVVLNKLQYRRWYDRIDQTVILGALPFRGKSSRMLVEQENVRAVISMNQDYELKPFSPTFEEWKSIGVEFLQLPTRDFVEAPSLEHIYRGVELIEKYIPSASVYVHCKAGRTRSATLVACYLVKRHNLSVDQAVEMIQSKRPHIYLADIHLNVIRDYQKSLSAFPKK